VRYVQEEGKEGVLSRAGCSRQRLHLLGRANQTTDESADDASRGG
jgi:hypothetical protein